MCELVSVCIKLKIDLDDHNIIEVHYVHVLYTVNYCVLWMYKLNLILLSLVGKAEQVTNVCTFFTDMSYYVHTSIKNTFLLTQVI